MLLEVCIDTLEAAMAAEQGGAHRLEVCGDLSIGGVTPSQELLKSVKKHTSLPIMMMIRPRGGNFVYSDDEAAVMMKSIRLGKELGVNGFVFGMLQPENDLNVDLTVEMHKLCQGYETTYHRAFDECSTPIKALGQLIDMGFTRILTSGQQSTAIAGKTLIKKLVDFAGDQLTILPGSGVTSKNAKEIIDFTGAKEIHGSCKGLLSKTDASEVAKVLEMLT